jgi:hypothetical protein
VDDEREQLRAGQAGFHEFGDDELATAPAFL